MSYRILDPAFNPGVSVKWHPESDFVATYWACRDQ
jgi:hypothetical protein